MYQGVHIEVCESLVATVARRWKSDIQRIHALASIATFLKEPRKPQGAPGTKKMSHILNHVYMYRLCEQRRLYVPQIVNKFGLSQGEGFLSVRTQRRIALCRLLKFLSCLI